MKIFSFKGLTVLFGLMLLSLLPPCKATGMDPSSSATGTAETNKIHITAQRLISDHVHKNAEFIGDVHARQGDTLITADRLKLFFADKPEADKTSPVQSLEKLVATENVEIKFDNRLAVAQQAVYITAERKLVLTGPNATVTSGDNTITGETITFYREDGRFTVEGGSNGRVRAVILPEESGLE